MNRVSPTAALRVVHLVESLTPRSGGPTVVVVQLAAHQCEHGVQVRILTTEEPGLPSWWEEWRSRLPACAGVELICVPRAGSFRAPAKILREAYSASDVIHIHGIWDSLPWGAMQLAGTGGAATVLAPHGMLSPWSLRHKRLKKRVALALIWRRSLRRVDLFHALNEIERQDLERELPAAPVAVVPNGVNLEEFASPPDHVPSLLDPLTGGRPFVLFLARLHYVKGPDRLLEAFALALQSGLLPGADLIMAGPDFGMLERLRAQARTLGLGSRVRFIGNIGGAAKLALLRNALCLCQPSRYEGFSITLLESLACGVPVVITPESNFPEVALHGAGLVVEGTAEKLSGALVNIIRDPEMRVAMGRAGVELVRREFTWGAVAERSLLAYERLRAGNGAALTQRALA